jgi:hypothetical protein
MKTKTPRCNACRAFMKDGKPQHENHCLNYELPWAIAGDYVVPLYIAPRKLKFTLMKGNKSDEIP